LVKSDDIKELKSDKMAKYKGKKVRKSIVAFYTRKKHYSTKRANDIAGAVALEEHKARHKHTKHLKHHRSIFARHFRRHRR